MRGAEVRNLANTKHVLFNLNNKQNVINVRPLDIMLHAENLELNDITLKNQYMR